MRPDWQPPAHLGAPLIYPPFTDDRTGIIVERLEFDSGAVVYRAVPSDRKDHP